MVVRQKRSRCLGLGRTDVEPRVLGAVALETGPSEIARDREVGDAVELLPGAPADVRDDHLVRSGAHDHAERVAQPVRDHALLVGVGAREERVVGKGVARRRVDAQDRAVEQAGLAGRAARRLAAERAAASRGLRLRRAERERRVGAGVGRRVERAGAALHRDRAAELAPVGGVEARAVAARNVELLVQAEIERAGRVAGVLLTPVLEQHLFLARFRPVVSDRRQPREPAADQAAVRRRARPGRRARAGVREPVRRGGPPGRHAPDRGVVRVEDIDVAAPLVGRGGVEARRHGEPQQAAVPEVVHADPEVADDRVRVGRQVGENLQQAALLGHEDSSVGEKTHDRGVGEPAEDDRLREPRLLEGRGGSEDGGEQSREKAERERRGAAAVSRDGRQRRSPPRVHPVESLD